jgi:hypothetical protein
MLNFQRNELGLPGLWFVEIHLDESLQAVRIKAFHPTILNAAKKNNTSYGTQLQITWVYLSLLPLDVD